MNWNADENKAGGAEQQSADPNHSQEGEGIVTESESESQEASSSTTSATEERRPRRRGFAAMDRDRVR